MTHSIDTSFKLRKEAAAARRRRALWQKLAAVLAIGLAVAGAALYYYTADYWSFGEYDQELEMTEETVDLPPDAAVYVPAIVDLAGDPMWITLSREAGAASKIRKVARPADLASFGVSAQIDILSDAMLSSSERFMTTIPSSQEDFEFFQAQQAAATMDTSTDMDMEMTPVPEIGGESGTVATATDGVADDAAAGWGETVEGTEEALPEFRKTAIENNTSTVSVTQEFARFQTTEDIFVKILNPRSLDSVVLEARFSAEDARLAGEALKALFSREALETGYVVALRGFRPKRENPALSLKQVSIYANDTYIGTLARNDAGVFVVGVDPWVRDDLFNYSGQKDVGTLKRQYRLLDAIYSTAARNNVPTGVIGEAIMYLSRGQDLNAFATYSDRFVLIYSDAARGKNGVSGRVLYAGVHGEDRNLECFVFQQSDGEFACVSRDDQVHSVTVSNGMVTPVKGVMTSTFGPRKHPILKTVRIHKGVDWAAPAGTPIHAAYDGQISFQGDGAGYGNLVKISHPGGRETRYAHMQRFAANMAAGQAVKAGDVIGYVGTTGLSTGPHLHFELYLNSEAIDPLGTVTVASVSASTDDEAVETLTDRIVRVESGGNARAKNPLSSATGLGQFIESTWIRMMNTYRPDLATSLSRAELLALRFDATISREMVKNLAREGEAYLRARGHQITAGRLYLCHFLGMDGAHQVLASSADAMLVDVLGAGVIRANPFLTGKNVAYVQNWAEGKMRHRGRFAPTAPGATVVTREIKQTSPEFLKFKATIAEVVKTTETAL